MSRSLGSRVDRLEEYAPSRPGLGVLETHELETLSDALKEEDPDVREAKFAAVDLCPRSEEALIEFIAKMQEQNDGKH